MAFRGQAGFQSRTYEVCGANLHARVSPEGAGKGQAVVLVHGVIVSSRYLMPLALELSADFPVLVPDLPGYGLSDRPSRAPDLAMLADAVIECASSAGHETVSLVGNSFGSQIIVEAALRHPEHVGRIAMLAPTVDPGARTLQRQFGRWLCNAPDEHPSCAAVMARDLIDLGVPRAARLLRVMLDDAIEEKLPHVGCPAMVMRGGRDRVVPDGWARKATALLPQGAFAVVPGYAHMAHYSGPLALLPDLRRFLLAER